MLRLIQNKVATRFFFLGMQERNTATKGDETEQTSLDLTDNHLSPGSFWLPGQEEIHWREYLSPVITHT